MNSGLQHHLQVVADLIRQNSGNPELEFLSMEEFVLAHGKIYTSTKLKTSVPFSTPHECYKNALELLYVSDEYTYVEGYLSVCGVPIQHAWCVKDGLVVDPTIPNPDKDWEYMGVSFDKQFVIKTVMKRKRYGIIDNPEHRFPLLQGKHKDKIIK